MRYLVSQTKKHRITNTVLGSHAPRTSALPTGAGGGRIDWVRFPAFLFQNKKNTYGVPFVLEQAAGIEPVRSAWEAEILPLNYACIFIYDITEVAVCQVENENTGEIRVK